MIKKIKDSSGVEHQIDYESLANLPTGPVTLPNRGAVIQLAESLLEAMPQLADGQKHTIEFTAEEEGEGSGGSGGFIATYGTTTYAEIKAAYDAGKMCFCIDSSTQRLAPLCWMSGTQAQFSGGLAGGLILYAISASNNAWTSSTVSPVKKDGDTMTGALVAANGDVATSQVRNIYAGTTDMTAGSTSLSTGTIYLVYE